MNTNSEITLCLIVRDEEDFLEACLTSAMDVVRHIVIADTGSSDRTIDIAQRFTGAVLNVPFQSFGATRNAVLEHVETEWILFLDADEQFQPEQANKLVRIVAEAPANTLGYRVLRYDFFSTGGWFSGRRLKLFRNRPDIRYEGRINESVEGAINDLGGRVENAAVMLNHFGHCRSYDERQAKSVRYMRLLEEHLLDAPDDGIRVAYLALQLRNLGRFGEALMQSQRAVSLCPESPKVYVFRGHILRSVGDLHGARAAYRHAIRLNSSPQGYWTNAALLNMVGVMDAMIGDLHKAEEHFKKAWSADPALIHVLINLGLLAEARGDFAEAVKLYEQVGRLNPAFLLEAPGARLENDPIRPFYYETVTQFAGLGHHLAYSQWRIQARIERAEAAG